MFTVVIPTRNESHRIGPTLKQVVDTLDAQEMPYEVLVTDNSTDETPSIVEAFSRGHPQVKLHHHDVKTGKGGNLVEGLKVARGDVVLYDADASTPAVEIPKIVQALGDADVVIGSRYSLGRRPEDLPWFRLLASRSFNVLVKSGFGLAFDDTQCGFKAVKAQAVAQLMARPWVVSGWEWDIELLLRAKQLNLKVVELAVEWHHGKEGGIKDAYSAVKTALAMLWGLLRLRFSY